MKILTDAQAKEIFNLLLQIEKAKSKTDQILQAEKIKVVLQQADQVTLKLEH